MRKLGKNSALYAVGTLLRYSAALVLIPVYTAALSASEYGSLETLTVIAQTLLILAGFGLSNAVIRYYSECKNEADIYVMLRTSSFLAVIISSVIFVLILPLLGPISQSLFKGEVPTYYVAVAILWSIGGALNEQFFGFYRARQDAQTYVFFSIGMFLVLVGLNITFVRAFHLGVVGVLLGNLISVWGLNGWFASQFWLRSQTMSWGWAKRLSLFGLPLVFSRIGWLVLNSADRYFLAYYRDLAEVGVYGLGYKTGLMVQIIVIVPFQLAWGPYLFDRTKAAEVEEGEEFSLVFTYLLFAYAYVALALFVFSEEIVGFLGSGKLAAAANVVPFVLCAYLFYAVYQWSGNLFHLAKKTASLSAILAAMALLNLILNRLTVPIWGWQGAALVTVITIGAAGLLTLAVSRRYFPVPLQLKRLLKLAIGVALVVVIYQVYLIDFHSIPIRLVLLLTFPVILFGIGFFVDSESKYLGRLPIRVWHKLATAIAKHP